MDIRKIDDAISVAPQIQPEDVPALKDLGFRSVICNRPDGEAADQPVFEEVEKAAKAVGMDARYVPIVPGHMTDQDVTEFAATLQDLPGPVLAYCRTGTRSTTLWSLAMAGRLSLEDILTATQAAGYDMGGVAQRITDRARGV